jgi:hypothetical protein
MDSTILIGILKSNHKLALKHALVKKIIENAQSSQKKTQETVKKNKIFYTITHKTKF